MPKLPPDDPSTDEPRTPLQRKLRSRRNNRRADLRSLDGCIRESCANYRDMKAGAVSLESGDIFSRVLSRHRELLTVHNQEQYLADLVEQLKVLNNEKTIDYSSPDLDDPLRLEGGKVYPFTKQT